MNNVIQVENLGKKYIISHQKESYTALRDVMADSAKKVAKAVIGKKEPLPKREEFWALRNISFDVNQGDRIGIIGRNGAGKSTLLKLLSRITEPTEGKIKIKGKISTLLEVGTGFHQELTGRENIFLNGAILGMSKQEIKKKFDEIVEFSGVEKFLDTPVKRYSSGMYVRLAFAIAAHLESEILLIDEVLAVGDLEFQKKCLGKMGEISKNEGRTVIFVSHNMNAIRQLCRSVLLLDNGQLILNGDTEEVIKYYIKGFQNTESPADLEEIIKSLPLDPVFRLKSINLFQFGEKVFGTIVNGEPLEIEISYKILTRVKGFRIYFDLCDSDDMLLFRSFHDEQAEGIPTVEPGNYISRAIIPKDILGPINYNLYINATIFNERNVMKGIKLNLSVINSGSYNKAYINDTFRGKLGIVLKWDTKKL